MEPSTVLYLLWIVAPKIESNIAPKNPENIIANIIFEDNGIRSQALNPIIELPSKAPIVPILVTPPDIPNSTVLNDIIDIGFFFDSFPNSVAHVADIAAATLDKNK